MDQMKPVHIIAYDASMRSRWDDFVRTSRSATFLHLRSYMDYHADRFPDRSMLAMQGEKILAMLPCCLMPDGSVSSHGGLTYGGWLLPPAHVDACALLTIFDAWLEHLRADGVSKVTYKPLPYIYAARPSQEDLYALWRNGFTLSARLLSSTVDLREAWKFSMSKRQQLKRAQAAPYVVAESQDLPSFWQLLQECLHERHDAAPVHSLAEIELLHSRFPRNIRLFTVTDTAGRLHAGVLIFVSQGVAHSQYAATSPEGRAASLLTLLYHHLMTDTFASMRYFDFGTSNEQQGRVLNTGLLGQKFSMGGTGVAYDTYTLTL